MNVFPQEAFIEACTKQLADMGVGVRKRWPLKACRMPVKAHVTQVGLFPTFAQVIGLQIVVNSRLDVSLEHPSPFPPAVHPPGRYFTLTPTPTLPDV